MDKFEMTSIMADSVWMTTSGYPAIISKIESDKIFGLALSPSGPKNISWGSDGKNEHNLPEFYDLKYSPRFVSNKYAIIKDGTLIGTDPEFESAKRSAELNNADLVVKFSELRVEMFI